MYTYLEYVYLVACHFTPFADPALDISSQISIKEMVGDLDFWPRLGESNSENVMGLLLPVQLHVRLADIQFLI